MHPPSDMTPVILQPLAKQLYEVNPQNSHPRISLRRVLWVRVIRWLDKASPEAMAKLLRRVSATGLILLGVFLPDFMLTTALKLAVWNGGKIPLAVALVLTVMNWRRGLTLLKRIRVKRRGGSQNLYHGVPVGEFAAWLMEAKAFKRDEAMAKWGLSYGRYEKVAAELEEHGLLTRGEKNARVLREIPMADLVRQLRDKFPLAWSEERQLWFEREGTFERWAISQDFKQRKLDEETARKERKLQRLKKQVSDLSPFAQIQALSA